MNDDYTTNSHYLADTFLYIKGWENVLFEGQSSYRQLTCVFAAIVGQPEPARTRMRAVATTMDVARGVLSPYARDISGQWTSAFWISWKRPKSILSTRETIHLNTFL